MTTKHIPEPVLKEWEQDLEEFANQVTQDLPEEKADSIRSVIHLASTLIQEVFFLRNQRHSSSLIRHNLHKQILRLEKMVKEVEK